VKLTVIRCTPQMDVTTMKLFFVQNDNDNIQVLIQIVILIALKC
jgi:hypothetical protein